MLNRKEIEKIKADGKMTVGFRFKQLREEYRYSGTAWGELLDLPQEKVSRIENDDASIGHDVLLVIQQKFGISIDWLLTGKGPKNKLIDKNTLVTDVNLMREEMEVLKASLRKQDELIDVLFRKLYGQAADKASLKKAKALV